MLHKSLKIIIIAVIMANVLKILKIYSNTHERFKALCKSQKIQIQAALQIILNYVINNKIDIQSLEDNQSNNIPALIKGVNDNIIKSSNKYVSFQRTFESENLFTQYSTILLIYNSMQFDDKDKKKQFKEQLFSNLILLKLHTHPNQKLINSVGGAKVFGDKFMLNEVAKRWDLIKDEGIFLLMQSAIELVNDAINNYKS